MLYICKNCKKEFKARPSDNRVYCSHKCRILPKGENAYRWNGGKTKDMAGYIVLSNLGNRITEHRYIMEQHLGRKLRKEEEVHHINGIKDDNRIENLEILDKSTHATITLTGRVLSKETKAKISKANRGMKRSDDARERMRLAQLEYINSKTTIERNCKYCNKSYQTKNSRKIFCDKNCAKRFYRK